MTTMLALACICLVACDVSANPTPSLLPEVAEVAEAVKGAEVAEAVYADNIEDNISEDNIPEDNIEKPPNPTNKEKTNEGVKPKECPPDVPVVNCLVNPCEGASCPSNDKAVCKPNYCGGCNYKFYENGREVVCAGQLAFTAKDWKLFPFPGAPKMKQTGRNKDFEFDCTTNDPKANVSLLFQETSDTAVDAKTKFGGRLIQAGSKFTLYVESIMDGGLYKCSATAADGTTAELELGNLNVQPNFMRQVVPEIIPRKTEVEIQAGRPYTLKCEAKGGARGSFLKWYKLDAEGNDQAIHPARATVTQEEGRSQGGQDFDIDVLSFKRFETQDQGTYKCVRKVANTPATSSQIKLKLIPAIKVDGGWTEWDEWSSCTKSCGSGEQFRKRFCTAPKPLHGGEKCSGHDRQSKLCNIIPCPARALPPSYVLSIVVQSPSDTGNAAFQVTAVYKKLSPAGGWTEERSTVLIGGPKMVVYFPEREQQMGGWVAVMPIDRIEGKFLPNGIEDQSGAQAFRLNPKVHAGYSGIRRNMQFTLHTQPEHIRFRGSRPRPIQRRRE